MLYDNLPTTPGALLGYRKNGQPIHLIAGASGDDDPSEPTTEPAADPTSEPEPQPKTDPTPARDNDPEPGRKTDDGIDDRTRKTIEAIRGDFKEERAKRQAAEAESKKIATELAEFKQAQQDQMDRLAKAFGLKPDDTPPDPAKLAEDLKAERAQRDQLAAAVREREVQLAVLQAAGKHDADGAALLDSRSFVKKVEGLDPASDDFADKVSEAITAAVEATPRYKLTPAKPAKAPKPEPTVPKSGGEFNGSPGGQRQWTEEDVVNSSATELTEAINQGLLVNLGFGPARKKR